MESLNTKIMEVLNCQNPQIQGWCSTEKALAMATDVVNNNRQSIVEIGIFGGKSFIPLALACQYKGSGRCYGIDPWERQACLEGANHAENDQWWAQQDLEGIYRGFVHTMCHYGLLGYGSWFRTSSAKATNLVEIVDFLHIDGNHSEEKSVLDVKLWFPKVPSGGTIVLDDIDWPTTAKARGMLKEFCNEFATVNNSAFFRKN